MALFNKINDARRKILARCHLTSLAVHILLIAIIHNSSFHEKSSAGKLAELEKHKKKSNEFLREAFSNLALREKKLRPDLELLKERPNTNNLTYKMDEILPNFLELDFLLEKENLEELLSKGEFIKSQVQTFIQEDHIQLLSDIEKASLIPDKRESNNNFLAISFEEDAPYEPKEFEVTFKSPFKSDSKIATVGSYKSLMEKEISQTFPELNAPIVSSEETTLPSLSEMNTRSCADDFDIDLVYLEHKEEGHLFALTLIPKPDLKFEKLKHNVYFIVDKSNAIQKSRLKTTESAISRALNYLGEEDSFNIIAYSNTIERLSIENLPPSKAHKARAKDFLGSLRIGSMFAKANPYRPLQSLLFEISDPSDLSSIIFITNGNGFTKNSNYQFFISNIQNDANNRYHLHALTLNSDNNLPLLDFLTTFNGGNLFTSSSQKGLKRKLQKLIKSISNPIAKNVSLTSIRKSPGEEIHLYPSESRMPALYLDQPFVILGTVKELDDFVLFIQGKNQGEWLNIKKNISFKSAKKADTFLEKEWAQENSFDQFENYLLKGDEEYMIQAHEILESHNLPSIF